MAQRPSRPTAGGAQTRRGRGAAHGGAAHACDAHPRRLRPPPPSSPAPRARRGSRAASACGAAFPRGAARRPPRAADVTPRRAPRSRLSCVDAPPCVLVCGFNLSLPPIALPRRRSRARAHTQAHKADRTLNTTCNTETHIEHNTPHSPIKSLPLLTPPATLAGRLTHDADGKR